MIETTLVYAIGFGAFFAVLILRRPLHRFVELVCPLLLELAHHRPVSSIVKHASRLVAQRLCYPTVLRRGKYTDRWSRKNAMLVFAYVAANVACVLVPLPGVDQVVRRLGTLSVVNMLFLFAGPHLSFLADILGLSVNSCRRLHGCAGAVAFLLAVSHSVAGAIAKGSIVLSKPQDLFALTVGHLQPTPLMR
ncbi:hypothetical protein VFPPC_18319 [Pochonia chlamydosporia 170]|uniref:Uncharacterized protein n=1 Tax=Pochonia chlamydosporia 170 TaxID=1380566 RepID=A0A219AP10_METCM|nr:hypothetical protein VFPPC_18319 [Pochonia chlamydosporia 170]OWT42580.1 hypothetical protein VFPPC_18319 [Pochonia chlamydosporia 170]